LFPLTIGFISAITFRTRFPIGIVVVDVVIDVDADVEVVIVVVADDSIEVVDMEVELVVLEEG
jgi:hypothetical protein